MRATFLVLLATFSLGLAGCDQVDSSDESLAFDTGASFEEAPSAERSIACGEGKCKSKADCKTGQYCHFADPYDICGTCYDDTPPKG